MNLVSGKRSLSKCYLQFSLILVCASRFIPRWIELWKLYFDLIKLIDLTKPFYAKLLLNAFNRILSPISVEE